jgi:HD domain
MGPRTRRSFLAGQAVGFCFAAEQDKGLRPPEIAGIRVAASTFTKVATEALYDCAPPYLVNHSLRTFFFGALIGRRKRFRFDEEVLFLACALHDLGLTPKYVGGLPFELQGAQAARRILSSAGLTADKTQLVWDGIAMHPHAISSFQQPEILLVAAGAGADVVGEGLSDLSQENVQSVLKAIPRLQFKRRFIQNCADVASKYPGAAKHSFMRDIAERSNPGYRVSNICDGIAAAPFPE